MINTLTNADIKETPEEFGKSEQGLAERWKTEIDVAMKAEEDWRDKAEKAIERYTEEDRSETARGDRFARFNSLWANVQTLQPAIYAKAAKPQVERRHDDADPVGRVAAQVLERALETLLEADIVDPVVNAARDDVLLSGRGQIWVRYESDLVETGESDPETGEALEDVANEQIILEHVTWSDYLEAPSKEEKDIRWKARRLYLRRDELIDAFGEEKGKEIPLNFTSAKHAEATAEKHAETQEVFKRAVVWEIWNKEDKKVYWYAEGFDRIAKVKEDFLKLEGFFPCPPALRATTPPDSTIPIPDYEFYKDQAREIDELTARINLVLKAIRATGVYDKNFPELQELLSGQRENKLYPVDNWVLVQQAGGLEAALAYLPVDQLIKVVQVLYDARDRAIQAMYEISGISDVIRGATDPNETYGAQSLKSQYGSMRLNRRQRDVQAFCRDLYRVVAELVCEHFQPNTLALLSGAPVATDPQIIPELASALALLKEEKVRKMRIDIETDSTLAPDEQREKESRTEFLQMMSGFTTSIAQQAQMMPQSLPLMGEMLLFAVRGFRAGRQLESRIEDFIKETEKQTLEMQGQPPSPPPEMLKMQAQQQTDQAKMQLEAQKMQAQMQITVQEKQAQLQLDAQKLQQEMALKQQELQTDAQIRVWEAQQQLNLALQKLQGELALKQQMAQTNAQEHAAQLQQHAAVAQQAGSREPVVVNLQPTIHQVQPEPPKQRTRKVVSLETDPATGKKVGQVVEIPEQEGATNGISSV